MQEYSFINRRGDKLSLSYQENDGSEASSEQREDAGSWKLICSDYLYPIAITVPTITHMGFLFCDMVLADDERTFIEQTTGLEVLDMYRVVAKVQDKELSEQVKNALLSIAYKEGLE